MDVFNYLINNAEIITIATDGEYGELEKKDNDISEIYFLKKLLVHIENTNKFKTADAHRISIPRVR